MQYLMLIYNNEAEEAKADQATMGRVMAEYGEFTQGIIQSGQFQSANRLKPTSTSTTVRVRDGKTVTTDGPFAETREQLGGYYLIEAANLDDAIAVAARIPTAKEGCVEVRPIWAM